MLATVLRNYGKGWDCGLFFYTIFVIRKWQTHSLGCLWQKELKLQLFVLLGGCCIEQPCCLTATAFPRTSRNFWRLVSLSWVLWLWTSADREGITLIFPLTWMTHLTTFFDMEHLLLYLMVFAHFQSMSELNLWVCNFIKMSFFLHKIHPAISAALLLLLAFPSPAHPAKSQANLNPPQITFHNLLK